MDNAELWIVGFGFLMLLLGLGFSLLLLEPDERMEVLDWDFTQDDRLIESAMELQVLAALASEEVSRG